MKHEDNTESRVQVDAEPCFFTGLLLGTLLGPRTSGGGGDRRAAGAGRGPVMPGTIRRGVGPVGPMGTPGAMFPPGVRGGAFMRRPGMGPVGRPGGMTRTFYHY